MPANTLPIFTLVPDIGRARIVTANTASDGSGTLYAAFTAGVNGSRIDSITFISSQATYAATSPMVGRVFVTDTAGINPRLLVEIALPSVTKTASVLGQTQTISFSTGLIIPAGTLIQVCQSVYATAADQYDVIVRGGDF